MVTGAIRLLQLNEAAKLQRFLHEHWRANHRLATDLPLLDWQHRGPEHYNFVVAPRNDEEFDAVLGFIPTGHFSEALGNENLWLALWKKRDDCRDPSLGFRLLTFLEETFQPTSITTVGINEDVKKLYRAMKFTVGDLQKAYIACQWPRYQILAGEPDLPDDGPTNLAIRNLDGATWKSFLPKVSSFAPSKDLRYFERRYELHPSYRYQFLGIFDANVCHTIFVARWQGLESARCLRLVDFCGALPKASIRTCFQTYLRQNEAEYVDFLHAGLSIGDLRRAGFSIATEKVVLPEYFQPFVQRNQTISYAQKVNAQLDKPFLIVRGDGDQDRPN